MTVPTIISQVTAKKGGGKYRLLTIRNNPAGNGVILADADWVDIPEFCIVVVPHVDGSVLETRGCSVRSQTQDQ